MEKCKRIAEYLVSEHGNKMPFGNLTADLKPHSENEAYLAQHHFHELAGRGRLGGYKIALSSKIQQEHHNISQPLIGGLFEKEIRFGPQTLDRNQFMGLGIEIELAFQLSDKITEYSKEICSDNLVDFIEKIFPAIELVEDRNANYAGLDPLSLICDNAWSGGLILGKELKKWQNINFYELYSKVLWNDETSIKACVMDANPFENLCWLLNNVKMRGKPLKGGMIIITGSVLQIKQAVRGDKIRHWIEPEIEASVQVG